jgi:PKD domain
MSGACRRWPLAAGLVIALLTGILTPIAHASESSAPTVQIGLANGRDLFSPTISSAPDIVNQSYEIEPPGAGEQAVTVTGYSLASFLAAWEQHTGVSATGFSLVEIPGETGTTLLTAAEAMSPNTTKDAPVLWKGKQGNVDFADSNPADYVSDLDQVRLYTGSELHVSITAAKTKISDNTSASVTASVSPAAGSIAYQWYAVGNAEDDRLTGPTYDLPFSAPGSYRVYVVAESATAKGKPNGKSIGVSNQIQITVGQPKHSTTHKHQSGTDRHKRSHTSENGATGSTTAKQNAKHAATKHTTTAAKPDTTKHSSTSKHSAKAAAHKPTTTTTEQRQKPPPKRRSAGALLSGVVITSRQLDSADGSTTNPPGVQNPAQAGHVAKQITTRHGLHLGEGFWIALGVLAALTTGALAESGALRRRRLPKISLHT